jgi:hypothetical protein
VNPERRPPGVCPVCRARFRGTATCSRCGADLTALMLLVAHAYRLRQHARELLRADEGPDALACAEEAERLLGTPEGRLLEWVSLARCSQMPESPENPEEMESPEDSEDLESPEDPENPVVRESPEGLENAEDPEPETGSPDLTPAATADSGSPPVEIPRQTDAPATEPDRETVRALEAFM